MRTLDRYVIREVLAPFALALLVLTFILIIPFIIAQAETMIAKGVPWTTVARVMVTLLPAALGLTIPMSLLVALLIALGRLSGDREVVGDAGLRPQPAAAAAPGPGHCRGGVGGHDLGDGLRPFPTPTRPSARSCCGSWPTAPRAK